MIFYFSGTGNSRWVAEKLAAQLNDSLLYNIETLITPATSPSLPAIAEGEMVGFVFPVYAWGLPKIVEEFLRNGFPSLFEKRVGKCPYVWTVMTCGDDMGYTDRLLHKALAKAGLSLNAAFSVQMPNTYVCLPGFTIDDEALAARKVAATEEILPTIAADITARREVTRVVRGGAAWLKTYLLRQLFNTFLVKDKPFRTSEACTACGLCARSCPLRDIAMKDERPQWGQTSCTGCLRCFHKCPQRAIDWGRQTQGKSQKAALPRLLLCLVLLITASTALSAQVAFRSGQNYRIENRMIARGGVALGVRYDSATPLLHVAEPKNLDDVLWTITADGATSSGRPLYTIRHAETQQYVTFDGLRGDVKRYVDLTDEVCGDSSRWYFESYDDCWAIVNAKDPSHHWHMRNPSYIVGTYAEEATPGMGSQFAIFDEKGQRVTTFDKASLSFNDHLGGLFLNGRPAVFDKRNKVYMFCLPDSLRSENTYSARVNYDASAGLLAVNFHTAKDSTIVTFPDIKGGKKTTVTLRTPDGDFYSSGIVFTFLPIVEMSAYGFGASSNHKGTLRVYSADAGITDTLYTMKGHWRGNTSVGYAKKNYAIKLTDADGNSIDGKLLKGMRKDNNWILDAMFVDASRMRNRVSTDLWNDFAAAPYYADQEPKARTGTRGRFVEMILNGSYNGLYCLTEKMDRKQLKLRKIAEETPPEGFAFDAPQHGILYKAVEWHDNTYMGTPSDKYTGISLPEPSNAKYEWGGFEIKYPDVQDGEPIDWLPLVEHIKFLNTSSRSNFRRHIEEHFDLPAVRDYHLLQELALAQDNFAKNILWFIYDAQQSTKLSLGPWDFDGTWGIYWNGDRSHSDSKATFSTLCAPYGHNHVLFSRLICEDYDHWTEQLADRYCELRHDGPFHPDSLIKRFADYTSLFSDSGADKREASLWQSSSNSYVYLNSASELSYISSWIRTHVAALDEFYGYDSTTYIPTAIPTVPQSQGFAVVPGHGCLTVRASHPVFVQVCTLAGRPVATVSMQSGERLVEGLAPGIYLVGGHRVLVK